MQPNEQSEKEMRHEECMINLHFDKCVWDKLYCAKCTYDKYAL